VGSIRFDGVNKIFGTKGAGVKALDDINLEIAEKEFVAIVGPSGCGKTTCLRIVAGFEQPTSGTVSVNGKPVRGPGPERAVVFQHFALFPWKTVRQNIDLGLRNKNLSGEQRDKLIAAALGLMNLESYADAFPHQLSFWIRKCF
jgi:NitT/TauT family transport system ATP-binding protein